MKSRFTTIDIRATISELNNKFLGMRVANVYDIDHKTYLIKLAKPDHKAILLLESGIRIHSTDFDWPKHMTPSGFSMKLRKHLRTRRLEKIEQVGIDRIVDLQFGSGEAAYHVILELYDRGNLVLTDFEYTILNILRPRTDESQDVRFAVREKYPLDGAKQHKGPANAEDLMAILLAAKEGDNLKKILNPHLVYGPAVIEHCLSVAKIPSNARLGKEFQLPNDMTKLLAAIEEAESILMKSNEGNCKGYIVQKVEKKLQTKDGEEPEELLTYSEFQPFMFKQHESQPVMELNSFDRAVDEFFSKVGGQKLDMKALQQEKAAMKKLENVKKDHVRRLEALQTEQEVDKKKAQLIEMNLQLVDQAILTMQNIVANQVDWGEIGNLLKEAQAQGGAVACAIKGLRMDRNHITMLLKDPYDDSEDEEEDCPTIKPMKVDIDLGLSAYANARKYYDKKKHAATKEQKTIDASTKAFKSAEKKTKQTLKEVQVTASIKKARKTYWFEKFLWFISSENYLVIGGRDKQQNEYIVRRYFKPGDLYVHADLHGASTVIVKNPSGEPVPPKTLNEAGTMAICHSAAWDARVVTSAWFVHHDQVSKTAPSGEYLTTGSFMIRGKKNFLPPSYLVYGFGFLFKLDETSVFRHQGERKVRTAEEDEASIADSIATESEISEMSMETQDSHDNSSGDDEGDEAEQGESTEAGIGLKAEDNSEGESEEGDSEGEEEEDEEKDGNEKEKEEEEEEEESLFPDTSIQLQHVVGDKYTLQRNISSQSNEDDVVYLGDDQAVVLNSAKSEGPTGVRMSAKQRREMKKKAKQAKLQEDGFEDATSASAQKEGEGDRGEETKEPTKGRKKQQPQQQQQPVQEQQPPKRGQKAKMKKIKEKYGDQDEEERRLKMEILASAGSAKEVKKKGKKAKLEKEKRKQEQQQQQKQKQQQQQQQGPGKQPGRRPHFGKLTVEDIKVETLTIDGNAEVQVSGMDVVKNPPPLMEDDGNDSDEEKQAVLEEEKIQLAEDATVLDSLTGQPVPDDILLFTIPVCAPYSTLHNYKYKVKLTPGSTKRGKACRTALNMFTYDKTATSREKDLFKSVKDTDMSRMMPGSVKVSAPNLQKRKKKR